MTVFFKVSHIYLLLTDGVMKIPLDTFNLRHKRQKRQ